tara:strand:+ start:488 stop:667 length:180 start_codon:yes stop_codon:yes gene_type:complete
MPFRACSRLRLADGTYRFKGDPVPEAAGWSDAIRNKRIKQGFIEAMPEPPKAKSKKPKK